MTDQEHAKAATEWLRGSDLDCRGVELCDSLIELLRPIAAGKSVIVPIEPTRKLSALNAALAKLEPKPEKSPLEKAIALLMQKMDDNWTEQDHDPISFNFNEIGVLERGLTEALAQKWNVPTWDEMPKDRKGIIHCDVTQDTYVEIGRMTYEALRDKIMAMNDDVAQK